MFLHFIIFGKQVSLEAPDDQPIKETVVKALEQYKMPQGRPYVMYAEVEQDENKTPLELGVRPDSVIRLEDVSG